MSTLKIGDKFEPTQGFAGQKYSLSTGDEITIAANDKIVVKRGDHVTTIGAGIDDVELWLRGGLVVKTYSFPESTVSQSETKNRPEQENEDTGVLPVGNVPRPRGRRRAAPSDGG